MNLRKDHYLYISYSILPAFAVFFTVRRVRENGMNFAYDLIKPTRSPHLSKYSVTLVKGKWRWADALGRGQCTPIARGVSLSTGRSDLQCALGFSERLLSTNSYSECQERVLKHIILLWFCFFGVVVGPALAIALSTSVTRWSLWLRLWVNTERICSPCVHQLWRAFLWQGICFYSVLNKWPKHLEDQSCTNFFW